MLNYMLFNHKCQCLNEKPEKHAVTSIGNGEIVHKNGKWILVNLLIFHMAS